MPGVDIHEQCATNYIMICKLPTPVKYIQKYIGDPKQSKKIILLGIIWICRYNSLSGD